MKEPVVRPLPRGGWLLLILFITLIVSAITLTFTAHQNRQLLNELHKTTVIRDKAQAEWGRLLLEQSTWTAHGRIEALAVAQLKMKTPDPSEIRLVTP